MNWSEYDAGYSIGTTGAGGGIVARDEEHIAGARLTLEEEAGGAPYAVVCNIYGWLFHARFFENEEEAGDEFDKMRDDLEELLAAMPTEDEAEDEDARAEFAEELAAFVETYP